MNWLFIDTGVVVVVVVLYWGEINDCDFLLFVIVDNCWLVYLLVEKVVGLTKRDDLWLLEVEVLIWWTGEDDDVGVFKWKFGFLLIVDATVDDDDDDDDDVKLLGILDE